MASNSPNVVRSRSSRSQTRPSDGDIELQQSGTSGTIENDSESINESNPEVRNAVEQEPRSVVRFWRRFKGEGRRNPTLMESVIALATCSVLNFLLLLLPVSWAGHFVKFTGGLEFTLCLLSITALEKMTDFIGENLALYCGKSLGDLVVVTLDNVVEATLAIILLKKCELRLLQSTVAGVVLLHLLLVPGITFITGGREVLHQHLDPHVTELNKSLLTLGVLTLLIPAAFFAGVRDNVAKSVSETATEIVRRAEATIPAPVSDQTRDELLRLSRGLAVVLLIGYIGSRIYLHNPPGQGNALEVSPDAPKELKKAEKEAEEEEPAMSQWACLLMFFVTIPLTAITAEWLVDSLERVRETSAVSEEWLGLVLLPVVSFSGEALVTILFYAKKSFAIFFKGAEPVPPNELANGRTIDLSIQFTMFWMPLLVLIAWWANKPLFLLFDFFEVAIVIGACFLVNSVTDDAKTNWAEGLVLLSFYMMIATAAWFYDGQQELASMLFCQSVEEILAGGGEGGAASEVVRSLFGRPVVGS